MQIHCQFCVIRENWIKFLPDLSEWELFKFGLWVTPVIHIYGNTKTNEISETY